MIGSLTTRALCQCSIANVPEDREVALGWLGDRASGRGVCVGWGSQPQTRVMVMQVFVFEKTSRSGMTPDFRFQVFIFPIGGACHPRASSICCAS